MKKYIILLANLIKKINAPERQMPDGQSQIEPMIQELITEANKLPKEGEPSFLEWILSLVIKQEETDRRLAYYLFSKGLKLDAPLRLMGQNVSVIPFVCQFNKPDVIQVLIERFHQKITPKEPIHPIAIASIKRHPELTEYLTSNITRYCDYTPLSMAVHFGYSKLFEQYTQERPEEINQVDAAGLMPLIYAARPDRLTFFAKLMESGANILIQNSKGQTFFHLVPQETDFLTYFREQYPQYDIYWSSTELVDYEGLLPIHHAIRRNQTEWVLSLLERNHELLNIQDRLGRNLAFHAVAAGDLSLLERLVEHHHLSILTKDSAQQSLLAFSIKTNQLNIIQWLDDKKNINLADDETAILAAMQSGQLLEWCLNHPTMNFNMKFAIRREPYNLLQTLCFFKRYDTIVRFDLFRKYPHFVFEKKRGGNTAIDEFICNEDFSAVVTDSHILDFMFYIVHYLQATHESPTLSTINNFPTLIGFCLNRKLIEANDLFEGSPLFHLWETYFYNQCIKMIGEFKAGKWRSYLSNEALALRAVEVYEANIKKFTRTYAADLNLNAKDQDGLHFLAKMIYSGANSTTRIIWLITHIQGIKLSKLDSRDSSLLHLACETQNFEMIRWCVETGGLSILAPRPDGLNALDVSLETQNQVIVSYLLNKLSQKKRATYVKKNRAHPLVIQLGITNPDQLSDLKQQVTASAPEESIAEITSSPMLSECIESDSVSGSVEACSSMILATALPEIEISYEFFLQAVRENKLNWLKILKKTEYQDQLKVWMTAGAYDVFQASDYRYSVIYQLLRFGCIHALMTPTHWKQIILDVMKTQQARTLFLILNHELTAMHLSPELALDILTDSLELKQEALISLLLEHETIASTATLACVLRAMRLGLTATVFTLLNLDVIQRVAHVGDNQLFFEAAACNYLDACELLLQLPNVIEALSANNGSQMQQIKEAQVSDDVLMFMRKIPALAAIIEPLIALPSHLMESVTNQTMMTQNTILSPVASCIFPIYFYNPNYYAPIINRNAFYDAILLNDTMRLYHLFVTWTGELPPWFVFDLASFAMTHQQLTSLSYLFQLATQTFNSAPGFCNKLTSEAISRGHTLIVDFLLERDVIREHAGLYENRLLRRTIDCGLINQALFLMTLPAVRSNLNAMNHYALRWAANFGYITLIQALLSVEDMRRVTPAHFLALQFAYLGEHRIVMQHLFELPELLEYAIQQGGGYQNEVALFLQQNQSQSHITPLLCMHSCILTQKDVATNTKIEEAAITSDELEVGDEVTLCHFPR